MISTQNTFSRFYTKAQEEIKSTKDYATTTATVSKRLPAKKIPAFTTIKKISKAKFSVYLIYCESTRTYLAMKIFPYKDGKVNSYFNSEIRFDCLKHPNIIKIAGYESEQETLYQQELIKVSYLAMEYAPYGDFYDVVAVKKLLTDDKIMRTYFRQLITGLEYLHAHKVCHLDLKLENMLLGEDFMLKIADFDLSYVKGDSRVCTRGTKFYRAPELMEQRCRDMEAADVYAAGIILFVFKTSGILPHSETQLYRGLDLFNLLATNNRLFWQCHNDIQNKPAGFFDNDFKELFNAMTKVDPKERPTLNEIKRSKWFNGPVYTYEEMVKVMKKNF